MLAQNTNPSTDDPRDQMGRWFEVAIATLHDGRRQTDIELQEVEFDSLETLLLKMYSEHQRNRAEGGAT